jgi:plasmid stability protein
MAQLVVRNLDEGVKRRLKQRAVKNGRSLEGEVREILSLSVKKEPVAKPKKEKGFGTQLAEIFAGKVPPDFKIEEIRGGWGRPADFDK